MAFILLFAGNVLADTLSPPVDGECTNDQGEPIRYIALPHRTFKKIFPDLWFATARKDVVLYDYQAMSKIAPEHQEIVYWHECGHHALGHVPLTAYDGPAAVIRDESEADCYAAQASREKRGFKPSDIHKATQSMQSIGMSPKRIAITWQCAASQ